MTIRTATFVALVSLALTGCEPAADRRSAAGARDSAGIRIVENTDCAWPECGGWRVADEPTLDLGVTDGDPNYQFYRIRAALKLSDGRIVVANGGTNELRYYNASGSFLNASGGDGGGPGEFHSLAFVSRLPGDSLLAYDPRLYRLSVFDPSGRFVSSTNLSELAGRYGLLYTLGRFGDGSLLIWIRDLASRGLGEGAIADSAMYFRIDRGGAVLNSLGQFERGELYIQRGSGGAMIGDVPLGRQTSAAVDGRGFYFGDAREWEVRYYTANGELQRLVRRDLPALPLTAEDIAAARDAQLADATSESGRQFVARMFDEIEFPETMPAYRRLLVDSEGNLWVSEYRRPGDDQPRFVVFDAEGVMLGVVETPKGLGIAEIGPDYLIGRWVNELGIEHVRLYPLIKD